MMTVFLMGCGQNNDPVVPVTMPPLDPVSGTAIMQSLDSESNSRRLDLTVAVPDSGDGVTAVEIWARPVDGVDTLVATVNDDQPVRFTVPESGPFGSWEFMALALGANGLREHQPFSAETSTNVPEPIYLEDRHGESWEVTNAVLRYGLSLGGWGHGIGRNSIRPVIEPILSCPGDPDYPSPDNLAVILGLHVDGESRAYRVGDLNDREVVDDVIQGTHLAVTY